MSSERDNIEASGRDSHTVSTATLENSTSTIFLHHLVTLVGMLTNLRPLRPTLAIPPQPSKEETIRTPGTASSESASLIDSAGL